MPAEQGPPSYEVLAALVASLRQELADALALLEETRAGLGREREQIAELEARLAQNSRNSRNRRPVSDSPGQRPGRGRCGGRPAASPAGRMGI